jgi:hypothetical protein
MAANEVGTAAASQYIAFLDDGKNHSWIDGYTYGKQSITTINEQGNSVVTWYWVRDGYTIANDPKKNTPLSTTSIIIRPTLTTDGSDEGILTTGQVATSASTITTFSGANLNDITVGTFGAVSNSAGTRADPDWNYIIADSDGTLAIVM